MLNQLIQALQNSLTENSSESTKFLLELQKAPFYCDGLQMIIKNFPPNDDIHLAALARLKEFLKTLYIGKYISNDILPHNLLNLCLEVLSKKTLKMWKLIMQELTAGVGVEWIDMKKVLTQKAQPQKFEQKLKIAKGILMGGIKWKQHFSYSPFLKNLLSSIEDFLSTNSSIACRYYIIELVNDMIFLKSLGRFLPSYITIYSQVSLFCQQQHFNQYNVEGVLFVKQEGISESSYFYKAKNSLAIFITNLNKIYFLEPFIANKDVQREFLRYAIEEMSKTNFKETHLQFVNLILRVRSISPNLIIPFFKKLKEETLFPLMKFDPEEQKLLHDDPLQYARQEKDNENLRNRTQFLWLNIYQEPDTRNKRDLINFFNRKVLRVVLFDCILFSDDVQMNIMGVQLLIKLKSKMKTFPSYNQSMNLILTLCVLTNIKTRHQTYKAKLILALAQYKEIFCTLKIFPFHFQRFQELIIPKPITYSQYIFFCNLSILIQNPHFRKMALNFLSTILEKYFCLLAEMESVSILQAFFSFWKQARNQIKPYNGKIVNSFLNIVDKINPQYFQSLVEELIYMREMDDDFKLNREINIQGYFFLFLRDSSLTVILDLLRIYVYDLDELVENDWTYFEKIIEFVMKNKLKFINFIYVIRQFISKKGNQHLLYGRNSEGKSYWELLLQLIIYLIRDNSTEDSNQICCLLLPIYLIENFHGRIQSQILKGIWEIALFTFQNLNEYNVKSKPFCLQLIALLIWENKQLAFEYLKNNQIIQKVIQKLVKHEKQNIHLKRVILGLASFLTLKPGQFHKLKNMALQKISPYCLSYSCLEKIQPVQKKERPFYNFDFNEDDEDIDEMEEMEDMKEMQDESLLSNEDSNIDSLSEYDIEDYYSFFESQFLNEIDELEYIKLCVQNLKEQELLPLRHEILGIVDEQFEFS